MPSSAVSRMSAQQLFGQEHSRFRTGQGKDDFVLRAGIDFYDGGNVVAGCAESGDNREIATLVGEEPHRLVSALGGPFVDKDDLFVRQRVGSVAHGRLDVLALQGRIAI